MSSRVGMFHSELGISGQFWHIKKIHISLFLASLQGWCFLKDSDHLKGPGLHVMDLFKCEGVDAEVDIEEEASA